MSDAKTSAHHPAPSEDTPASSEPENAGLFHEVSASRSGMIVMDDPHRMVIDGRFIVLAEIGRGGFGTVYKCHDQLYGRLVAIKQLMPPRGQASTEGFELVAEDHLTLELRLQTEMQILARLEHPNIVNVHEYVNHSQSTEPDKYSYIVMELLDGVTLFDTMHRLGRLPVLEAVQITEQLLNALGFIHRNHFIHRDLKPENVFVLNKDAYALPGTHIKLLDFGLAIYKQASQRLTREGMIGGTVWYLSPEQCEGQDADELSDLFSVGMILFEVLTGDLPYKGLTHNERLMQKLRHEVGNWGLLRKRAQIHPDLEAFLARALAPDRQERFQSADEMLSALIALRESNRLVSATPTEPEPLPAGVAPAPEDATAKPPRERPLSPWWMAAPVVLLLGWLLFMGISVWSGRSDDTSPAPTPDLTPDASVASRTPEDTGASAMTPPEADATTPDAPQDAERPDADLHPTPDAHLADVPPEDAPSADVTATPDADGPEKAGHRRVRRRTRRPTHLSIPRMEMERRRRRGPP